MDIYTALLILLCVICLRYFRVFRIADTPAYTLPLGFGIKMLAALFFLYIYSNFYGNGDLSADASVFLSDGKVLNDVFYASPLDYFRFLFGFENDALVDRYLDATSHWDAGQNTFLNDSQNILRIHSVIHFISFNRPVIHAIVMCFLSLLGIRQLVLAIIPHSIVKPMFVFWIILLAPSALLWSSGIIKEPILIFGIGFICRALFGILSIRRRILYGLLGVFVMIGIKPYVLLCFVPALIVYGIFRYLRPILAWTVLTAAVLSGLVFITIGKAPSLVNKLTAQQSDFINTGRGGVYARGDTCIYIIGAHDRPHLRIDSLDVFLSKTINGEYMYPYQKTAPKPTVIHPNSKPWILYYDGKVCGSYIPVTYIDHSGGQLVRNIPEALTNTLLRPFPSDPPGHFMMWLTILEQWFILAFLTLSLFHKRRMPETSRYLVLALLTFALVLAVMIGWTTPVLGAIVRYRVPVQLALISIILIMIRPPKWCSND